MSYSKILENVNSKKDVEKIQKEFNLACKNRLNLLNKREEVKKLSSRPFGALKEAFEGISYDLYKGNGKKSLQEYIKIIRENKDLSKMHLFYECLRKADKGVDAYEYINEAVSVLGKIDRKNYHAGMKKLSGLCERVFEKYYDQVSALPEGVLNEGVNKAVEYVAFNEKNIKNLSTYHANAGIIKEYIENHAEGPVKKAVKNIDKMADDMLESFNTKYGCEFGEDNIVKEVFSADDKEEVFNKYKEQCLNKVCENKERLSSAGDKESSERLSLIEDKIRTRQYNPETLSVDVCNFIGLSECLE